MPADLGQVEYRALREAIAARGQLRSAVTLAGILGWAMCLLAVLIALPYPVASVVPLTLLVAAFEVSRPLHLGAERIGRYIQVFYEEAGGGASTGNRPAWERTAMAFGATVPGAGGHPLFVPLYATATLVNGLAILLPGPVPVEMTLLAVPHAAFLVWLARADRVMRTQRPLELERFRALRERDLST